MTTQNTARVTLTLSKSFINDYVVLAKLTSKDSIHISEIDGLRVLDFLEILKAEFRGDFSIRSLNDEAWLVCRDSLKFESGTPLNVNLNDYDFICNVEIDAEGLYRITLERIEIFPVV